MGRESNLSIAREGEPCYHGDVKKLLMVTLMAAVAGLLASCSLTRTLSSESGLYDVKLERNRKAMVDGGWTWGGGNPYAGLKEGSIYIAPLDISKVQEAQPELAPLLVPQMHDYVVEEVGKALRESNAAHNINWKLTDEPAKATVRVDMAVVHFRPQRPGLRLLSSIGGHFVKVPGVSDVVGSFAKGDICIEMTIRDGMSRRLLLACKDSNRKTARLISTDAYKRIGNADVNLRHWAKRLAYLIEISTSNQLEGRTLKEFINERSWGEVIKQRVMD